MKNGEADPEYAHDVSPLPDWELWSCALIVERRCGAGAHAHVAEQVGRLAGTGDWNGVATWRAIANRLDRLQPNAVLQ